MPSPSRSTARLPLEYPAPTTMVVPSLIFIRLLSGRETHFGLPLLLAKLLPGRRIGLFVPWQAAKNTQLRMIDLLIRRIYRSFSARLHPAIKASFARPDFGFPYFCTM